MLVSTRQCLQALRTNSIKSKVEKQVSHPFEDCGEKERKQSVMWLQNVKYFLKNSTAYGYMIELVQLFLG